jgi:FAD/FMN-containing dehydrogenase
MPDARSSDSLFDLPELLLQVPSGYSGSVTLSQQRSALAASGCEVAFDDLTRHLYATDASIHQIVSTGVAFPRTASETSAIIRAAVDTGLSITPRGAGTAWSAVQLVRSGHRVRPI